MMPQTPAPTPPESPRESLYEMPAPPMASSQAGYGYESSEQFTEAMAQRLVPRLMYLLRNQAPIPTPGQRLALAIVSLALMIPLIAIVSESTPMMATGLIGWLMAVGLICVTVMVVNIVFNGGIFTRR
jgi:hypothetical protein